MPRNILESVSRDLAEAVEKATDEVKRALCLPACQLAVNRTKLDEPLVRKALHLLEQGIFEDKQIVAGLEQMVGDLDDSYFAAERRYLAGAGDQQTYVALARKARAADAVLASFNDDAFLAATRALYETCAALGGSDEVRALARNVLGQKR